jgi:CRISPR-associated protein Csx17
MQTALKVDPLSSYLTALGLLKVLNRQLDSEARGYWKHGHFHLKTLLTPEEIGAFFATDYQPTACLTPWNSDSNFHRGEVPISIQNLVGVRFDELKRIASIAAIVIPAEMKHGKQGDDREKKIHAIQRLQREGNSDSWSAWLNVCAVLYTNKKGNQDARYPALLGGSGGAFGRADFGTQFVRSLAMAKPAHFIAAFSTVAAKDILTKDCNSLIYNPACRGDGQQGNEVAVMDIQKSTANPAEMILLAEGLSFFQGYATSAQSDANAGQSQTSQASFTLAVQHLSAGHASSSWLENKGQMTEELWCPLWDQPVSFQELRDELDRVAMLPLPGQLMTGTDFALFASQLGRRHGLSGFARYCFPPRVGQGTKIPSLIEVFPLVEGQEDRSDALAAVAAFAFSDLHKCAANRTIPTSYRNSAERVVAELEALSGGGGSYGTLLRHLVAWRRQEDLKPEGDRLHRFGFGKSELPPQWYGLLEQELAGPEWRLGLALASGIPYATLADITLLLADRIDAELVNDLEAGLGWIDPSGLPLEPEPEETLPWLPPDYLAAVLLNQWHFDAHVPIKGDRDRWQQLLHAARPAEAMEVALHRLRVADVVSWPWPAIAASDPQRLLRAVQLPVHRRSLGRAKAGG